MVSKIRLILGKSTVDEIFRECLVYKYCRHVWNTFYSHFWL